MIRELHVYGKVIASYDKDNCKIQHIGIGRKLLEYAEYIARRNGYNKIAVISGQGVKGYYRKFGYKDEGLYLVKDISIDIQISSLFQCVFTDTILILIF